MLARMVEEETDMGPRSVAAARGPLSRLCLASREVTPVDDMLRFVVGPDGQIVPDLARKLPGRGAWVSATRAAVETALKRKAFARAFKGKGTAGPELITLIDHLLEQDMRAALSLANKAGQVVTGAMKVESALVSGQVRVLLHASDARPDGVRKLNATVRQIHAAGAIAPAIVDCLSGIDLDLALGRSNVVHAALLAHPTTARFLSRCRKLARWKAGTDTSAGGPVSAARSDRLPDDHETHDLAKSGHEQGFGSEIDPDHSGQGHNGPEFGGHDPMQKGHDRRPERNLNAGTEPARRESIGQECSRAPGRMQGTETE
ncbi:RNA-binding protein [Xanthobacter sp. TB0136]|uniref:RNA-binding protein n=1 Tax=Xanthobacter sp. TB0136 TaxID=3459177 RepID=UPI00403932EE